jgi:hypothetical protein
MDNLEVQSHRHHHISRASLEEQKREEIYMHVKRFITKNWLTPLWRLRSPMTSICKPEV